jgi:hypothetical protein
VRAVAAKQHVWHALPGYVLLLARFARHPQVVGLLRQFGTERSGWIAAEWFSRIPDRDSFCALVKVALDPHSITGRRAMICALPCFVYHSPINGQPEICAPDVRVAHSSVLREQPKTTNLREV